MQCVPDLLETWYGHLIVAGNAYLEAVTVEGAVRELHALLPDRMKVVPGPDGWPEAHEYAVARGYGAVEGGDTLNTQPP
jgi:phage portal protein BeeE